MLLALGRQKPFEIKKTQTHSLREDSSSEMEIDEGRDETPRLIEDAEDFEGNDTNVH